MVFDLSKPGAKAIKSPMGGGWIVPLTDDGKRVLTEYFGEEPADLPPLRQVGWIVEPQEAGDLAEYLWSEGIAWEVRAS